MKGHEYARAQVKAHLQAKVPARLTAIKTALTATTPSAPAAYLLSDRLPVDPALYPCILINSTGVPRMRSQSVYADGDSADFIVVYDLRVVVACRSAARGQEAVEALAGGLGRGCRGCFEVAPLDLARLDSVRAFPEVLDSLGVGRVDVLVNNAGVMAVPLRTVTADGHEAQFQVNYLGHFLLSLALARRHAGAHDGVMRVVDVASVTAEGAALCLDDVSFRRRRYKSFGAYAQSKLCTILHAREFHRRWGHKVGQR